MDAFLDRQTNPTKPELRPQGSTSVGRIALSSLQAHSRCLVNSRWGASQVALMVKNRPANAGDIRDMGSIPGSGRYPGGGHGNLLQYSCLEKSTDRGAWWATVHGVTELEMTEVT